jgi:hypothetical protein
MNFDAFRESVMNDAALLRDLLACESDAALFEAAQAAARGRGFELSQTEFAAIVNANRKRWLERWLNQ